MNWWQAVILSIVEGLTEFLPISSTGHMILVSDILKITQTDFVKTFEIFIQIGAILAVTGIYSQELIKKKDLWLKIFLAFLPTAFLGFILHKFVKAYLIGNSLITVAALLIGGIILLLVEKWYSGMKPSVGSIDKINNKNAVLMGVAQSIAMIPGVSRSAATIVAGLCLGLDRKTAVEFSFLLAIPTLIAASALDLISSNIKFSSDELGLLLIGLIGAFITGWLAVKFFIKMIRSHGLESFGIYRIILAIMFWWIILRPF
jgi:undecaprenyl-diphosphatase